MEVVVVVLTPLYLCSRWEKVVMMRARSGNFMAGHVFGHLGTCQAHIHMQMKDLTKFAMTDTSEKASERTPVSPIHHISALKLKGIEGGS